MELQLWGNLEKIWELFYKMTAQINSEVFKLLSLEIMIFNDSNYISYTLL